MEGWWPEEQSRQREHMAGVPEAEGSRVHEELEDGCEGTGWVKVTLKRATEKA